MSGTTKGSGVKMRAFIGLGANLGDRGKNIRQAIKFLGGLDRTEVAGVSALVETEPLGITEQPRFINAVAEINTCLEPPELLGELKRIEREMGREDGVRWGPRPIDLDILIYGNLVLSSEVLTIPHAELENRDFVLEGILELDSKMVNPGTGALLSNVLKALNDG